MVYDGVEESVLHSRTEAQQSVVLLSRGINVLLQLSDVRRSLIQYSTVCTVLALASAIDVMSTGRFASGARLSLHRASLLQRVQSSI